MTPDRIDLDSNLTNLINGKCRFIKNMVRSKDSTFLRNEKGFLPSILLPNGLRLMGVISLSDDILLFSTDETHSEIGLYIDATDSYLTVLNNDGLAFSINHPIRGTFEKNYKGQRIVGFTDRFNVPRVINIDNLPNPFTLNRISAFPEFVVPQITITNVLDNGGNLPAGAIYIGANYIDSDGTETGYFGFTLPKPIIDDSYGAPYDTIDGATNVLTGKALDIEITGIDTTFKFIQLVAIRVVNGITESKIFKKIPIASSITTSYTGNEVASDIPNIIVLTPRNSYKSAYTVTQLSGKLTWGNLTSDDFINAQQIANEVKINYCTKLISLSAGQKLPTVDIGFMPGEVVAFYLTLRLKNGTAPLTFHIPGRQLASDEYIIVGSGDLIGGVGEIGKTRPIFSTLEGVSDLGTGFNTPFKYQIEDTTANILAETNMGYWENKDEYYPTTNDFSNVTTGSSTEFADNKIRVRHHRFPTLRKRGLGAYTTNSVEIYGINVSNVNLPQSIKDKIVGWEIWYARKDYNNATVLGHDVLLYGAGLEITPGTPNPNEIWTTAGNWQLSVEDTDADGRGIFYNKQYIRMHSPDLLFNKPSTIPSYITMQFKMVKGSLSTNYVDTSYDSGAVLFGNDLWTYAIDYTKSTNLTKTVVSDTNFLRVIRDRQYVPNNAINLPIYNVVGEEFIHAKLLGSDLGLTMHQLTVNPGHADNTLTAEETFLIAINALRRNVYETFFNQSLVSSGVLIDKELTTFSNIYNGDSWVGSFSFITTAARGEGHQETNAVHAVRIIRRFNAYASFNLNLRHQELGNPYSNYYPKTAIGLTDTEYPHNLQLSGNPNDIKYNRDYSAKLDLQAPSPFDPYNNFINNFPYRIIQSVGSSSEKKTTGWRTYLPNDIYELFTKSKGVIYNLESMNIELLIHCEKALFITTSQTQLNTDTLKVTLGSGKLFDIEPQEITYTKDGYTGTQHQFSCIMTKFGYFFINANTGKAFLYGGGDQANEVSDNDVRTFLMQNLPLVNVDNIFDYIGIASVYEEENERILLCIKNKVLLPSLEGNYKGIYVNTQEFIDTLVANESIVFKDNRYQLFKGLY